MLWARIVSSWDQITITLYEVNELFKKHCEYGWTLKLPPRNQPKIDDCNCFVGQFEAFSLSIKKNIIQMLNGNTMVWNLKDLTLTIYVFQLTNIRKWVLVLICLLTFIKIDQILTTYHFICMNDQVECEKIYINGC